MPTAMTTTNRPAPDPQPGRLPPRQLEAMNRYYRIHSPIYDVTRWSFLFGRNRMLRLAEPYCRPRRILEIGCGTGFNLEQLARRFPNAALTGVDVALPMLDRSRRRLAPFRRRVELLRYDYSAPLARNHYDLILFSYTLTMMNPGWTDALRAAAADLTPEGCLAVVDFDRSAVPWFGDWMAFNHVRIDGHLLPQLRQHFQLWTVERRSAYFGLWNYFCFLGGRRTENPVTDGCFRLIPAAAPSDT